MYKDARIAFAVILALMVVVVIIWGRSPSPDEAVTYDADQAPAAKASASTADATASEAHAEAPSETPAEAPDSARGDADATSETGTPAASGPPAPPGADDLLPAPPRDLSGFGDRPAPAKTVSEPSFPFPGESAMITQPRPRASVVHDGPPPAEPPAVEPAGPATGSLFPVADASGLATAGMEPPAPSPAEAPEQLAIHTVVRGDSYRKLARNYYKDESRWTLIFEANGVAPERLFIGKKLIIPALPAPAPVAAAAASPPTAPATAQRTHTVEKGESFYAIARAIYRNPGVWKKLYEHNRALLPNPDDPSTLRAGTVIELPTLDATP